MESIEVECAEKLKYYSVAVRPGSPGSISHYFGKNATERGFVNALLPYLNYRFLDAGVLRGLIRALNDEGYNEIVNKFYKQDFAFLENLILEKSTTKSQTIDRKRIDRYVQLVKESILGKNDDYERHHPREIEPAEAINMIGLINTYLVEGKYKRSRKKIHESYDYAT